jgi:hypothetical protein
LNRILIVGVAWVDGLAAGEAFVLAMIETDAIFS